MLYYDLIVAIYNKKNSITAVQNYYQFRRCSLYVINTK